jgi:hypothetical protein
MVGNIYHVGLIVRQVVLYAYPLVWASTDVDCGRA